MLASCANVCILTLLYSLQFSSHSGFELMGNNKPFIPMFIYNLTGLQHLALSYCTGKGLSELFNMLSFVLSLMIK